MEEKSRKIGIDRIGEVPWGTHFCLFYQTKEDLIDFLVPYFKTGLENNEFCMWVTSLPFSEKDAREAMTKAMPGFDEYLKKGQIEIVTHTEWYLKDGSFDLQRVLNVWIDKLNHALAKGYSGIRVTGDTLWLKKIDWRNFADYEKEANKAINKYRILAICTYSLDKCRASDVIDVVGNHQFSVIRCENRWELIENAELKRAEEKLAESEEKYRILFNAAPVGIGIADLKGNLIDANLSMLGMSGYTFQELKAAGVGATYANPDERKLLLKMLQETGKARDWEVRLKRKDGTIYYALLNVDLLELNGHKILLTNARDITERKQAEEELKEGEHFLSSIFSSIQDGIGIIDRDMNVVRVNPTAEKWYSHAMPLVGRKCYEAYHGRSERCEICSSWQTLKTGKSAYSVAPKHGPEGKEVGWIELYSFPWIDSTTGQMRGAIEYVRDITERKLAEKALEAALVKAEDEKNKSNAIIEALGDGIIIQDTDYKIIYQNQIQNDLYGNHTGEYCYKAYENSDTICEGCPVELAFRDGKIHRAERSMPTDKGTIHMELTGSPLRDSTGKIISGIKIIRDITEQKRAEETLRESEEKFRSVIEQSGDGIVLTDEQGIIIEWNQAEEEIIGLKRDEVIGRPLWEVQFQMAPEENRTREMYEKLKADTLELIRTGESRWLDRLWETDIQRPDGTRGSIQILIFLIKTSKGFMAGSISRDITERKQIEEALRKAHDELEIRVQERTAELINANETLQAEINERKRAEEALQQSEEKYRILIDNTQDGVFIIQDTKIQFANEAFAKIAGYTIEEILGKDFRELVAPEDLEMVTDRYSRRQIGEDISREYEFHLLHKDLITKSIINMNVGLITYRGKVASMGTVKDITEKKKLESQLLRAQRMESIGTLAGGIAHDINNVLTPIMLSLELLQGKLIDEEGQRLLNIIERSTQRGANLMKQVMSFARGMEGERTALQITHLISEIEKIVKETFPRSIDIRTDIKKDLWSISGDATQLHQVLMNLCVNARDAMPYGGILSISAENSFVDESYARMNIEAKVGPYMIVGISDNGVGIPPGILDRIFEPFFTTKEPGKGTGLGLSTALAIIKSHGGFINVYSEVGKGTTFKVHLPAIKTTETQKAEEQQHDLPVGHGELILVVDDESQIREITRKTLEKHGYRVITADDGAEAVALYLQYRDDIKAVLMDMMMPVMEGPASIRALNKISYDIKIIAVSGLTEKDKIAKLADTKVHAFLTKPYTAEKLLKTIDEVIRTK